MTVLIGGLRALNANVGQAQHGVFTTRPETLSNDFFVNLLDMGTKWQKSAGRRGRAGRPRPVDRRASSGPAPSPISSSVPTRSCALWPRSMRPATRSSKFVSDFVAAWNKVMNLDRFDLA